MKDELLPAILGASIAVTTLIVTKLIDLINNRIARKEERRRELREIRNELHRKWIQRRFEVGEDFIRVQEQAIVLMGQGITILEKTRTQSSDDQGEMIDYAFKEYLSLQEKMLALYQNSSAGAFLLYFNTDLDKYFHNPDVNAFDLNTYRVLGDPLAISAEEFEASSLTNIEHLKKTREALIESIRFVQKEFHNTQIDLAKMTK